MIGVCESTPQSDTCHCAHHLCQVTASTVCRSRQCVSTSWPSHVSSCGLEANDKFTAQKGAGRGIDSGPWQAGTTRVSKSGAAKALSVACSCVTLEDKTYYYVFQSFIEFQKKINCRLLQSSKFKICTRWNLKFKFVPVWNLSSSVTICKVERLVSPSTNVSSFFLFPRFFRRS